MYYRKWQGYRASVDAKREMISSHLKSIYDLCVDNWNFVLELSREDLVMLLTCFKLIKTEKLFDISEENIEKFQKLEIKYRK